ncbi:unnamed protein product [Paramecium sonneborni]|uniref:Uncharacterized protein n=1 Tax=Paramecium sonneborni TaxID=65129 RepID=A0A8S1MUP7_9CILI|nr:unnamed protein product [Paramecium sonneborni]
MVLNLDHYHLNSQELKIGKIIMKLTVLLIYKLQNQAL